MGLLQGVGVAGTERGEWPGWTEPPGDLCRWDLRAGWGNVGMGTWGLPSGRYGTEASDTEQGRATTDGQGECLYSVFTRCFWAACSVLSADAGCWASQECGPLT